MGDPEWNPDGKNDKIEGIADKAAQILKLLERLGTQGNVAPPADTGPKEHKFWTTQPVPLDDGRAKITRTDGPIEPHKPPAEIRQEPYSLPAEFEWCEINLDDGRERDELYFLLNQNYVEDIESLFRFDYPPQFLEWALRAPNWCPAWHVGVRVTETKKLVAFISAIPMELQVRSNTVAAVEVNFLCVHKRLRAKRLAPLMIREITRRVHLKGIFQALYTAGAVLPGLLGKARYYHRPLNYKKLVEVGFTALPFDRTMEQMAMRYHLSREHQLGSSMRPMRPVDVPQVSRLLSSYLGPFPLHPQLSEAEARHWLLPRQDILYSFVVECDGAITDFVSFYSLPSTVVNGTKHTSIRVAYLFYYAASSPAQLSRLIHAAVVEARNMGFDVFNCVAIMNNMAFIKDLQFGEGDGCLNYYLYNWLTAEMSSEDIAVVML